MCVPNFPLAQMYPCGDFFRQLPFPMTVISSEHLVIAAKYRGLNGCAENTWSRGDSPSPPGAGQQASTFTVSLLLSSW